MPVAVARIEWRDLQPGERDPERLWLCVTVATGVLGLTWLALHLPRPECMFHLATGLPCPGCGSTRAIWQLAHGEFSSAFGYNPLAAGFGLLVFAYNVYAATVLALGLPRLRIEPIGPTLLNAARVFFVIGVAANWWWVIARGL